MLYDTDFFIHRSGARNRAAALHFLAGHADFPLYTSRICWAELAEGVMTPDIVNDLLAEYSIIEIDADIASRTSRAACALKGAGQHIGDNDCWIAGPDCARARAVR